MTRRNRAGGHGERGFTLPELMIAVVVLSIIIWPLANATIVGLRTMFDAQTRLDQTRGMLLTSAYFSNDVQSAQTVTLGTTGGCGPGTGIVSFQWDDGANVAAYAVDAGALKRSSCTNGVASTSRLDPRISGANPTASCSPDCTKPRTVQMTLNTSDGPVSVTGSRRAT